MKWSEIQASEKFQSLPVEKQQAAKQKYLNTVVLPQAQERGLNPEEVSAKFMGQQQITQKQDAPLEESIANRAKAAITGAAKGLTFGYADELKSAVMGRPIEEIRAEDAALKKVYPGTSIVSEIGGAVASPVGRVIGGAIGGGGKLAARVLKGAGAGAVSGGIYGFGSGEGDVDKRLSSAGTGAALGGVIGGAMPAVVSGVKAAAKPFSSSARLAGKKTGIGNIVEDRSSLGQLKTGVKASDELASQMDDVAPQMRQTIYKKSADAVDDSFGKTRIDVNKSISNKENMIKDFYARNGKQTVEIPKNFTEGMNAEQGQFLGDALKKGAARTTSKPNSLNAMAEAKRELQSKIQSSMIPDPKNPMNMIATPETAQLQGVVSKLDRTLKSSVPGYGQVNRAFSNTQRVKSAYEMGLKGTDKGFKLLNSNVEKQAYKQGLKEKLVGEIDNAGYQTGEDVSKKVLKQEGLYRDVLGPSKASTLAKRLSKMSNATKDVNSIQKTAYDKMGRDVSELPFMREAAETKGSLLGALLDKTMGMGQGAARSNVAKKLLTPGLQFAPERVSSGQATTRGLLPILAGD